MKKKLPLTYIPNFKSYLLGILFFVVIGGLNFWIHISDNKLIEKGLDVTAVISDSGGKNITITFTFNNKMYTLVANKPHASIEIGETYNVKIDPKNPENFLIQFWKPIIRSKDFQKGSFTSVTKSWFSNQVKFSYIVNGEEYFRNQTAPPGFSSESLATATLLYNKEAPAIAYLFFKIDE